MGTPPLLHYLQVFHENKVKSSKSQEPSPLILFSALPISPVMVPITLLIGGTSTSFSQNAINTALLHIATPRAPLPLLCLCKCQVHFWHSVCEPGGTGWAELEFLASKPITFISECWSHLITVWAQERICLYFGGFSPPSFFFLPHVLRHDLRVLGVHFMPKDNWDYMTIRPALTSVLNNEANNTWIWATALAHPLWNAFLQFLYTLGNAASCYWGNLSQS